MYSMRSFLTLFILTILSVFVTQSYASVLGIDLSAEYLKVAAVKPGNPFHIVVDEQAKRKIPLAVAFDDGERHYGNNAVGFSIRKPLETYLWYHRLLGQTIDSPRVKALQEIFPYKFVAIPNRGGAVGIQKPKSDEIFMPEELIAMNLQHAMKIAKDEDIDSKDAVITVPSWFTPVERQAVLDAAEIAGLTVLSLINDNTASAITYGIDRTYKAGESHTALLIDIGSTGLEATVVNFSSFTPKKSKKVHGQAVVLGSSWDDSLGGLAFDKVIRDYLLQQFKNKYTKEVDGVEENPKALAKLLKQSVSAKIVLSANKDVKIRVENVFRDRDLDTLLTRQQFYDLATPLLQRVKIPLLKALSNANVTSADLDAVVIVGGTVRIPGVQDEIKSTLNRSRLDQNINGDEAMAMGSVFRAANVSSLFQVRPFGLVDISNFDIDAAVSPVTSSGVLGAVEPRIVNLFQKGQKLGKRAKIRFFEDKDIVINVAYNEDAENSHFKPLNTYKITGIESIAAELAAKPLEERVPRKNEDGTEEDQKPRLNLVFQLDQSGVVRLLTAEATVEEMGQVINPAFKKVIDDNLAAAIAVSKKAQQAHDDANQALKVATAALEALEKKSAQAESYEKPADSEQSTSVTQEELDAAKNAVAEATKKVGDTKTALDDAKQKQIESIREDNIGLERYITEPVSRAVPLRIQRIYADDIRTGTSEFVLMSPENIQASRTLLSTLNENDNNRRRRAAAFNDLETNMYAIKNELYDEEFEQVTTEEQRSVLRTLATDAEEWMYGEGSEATIETVLERAKELVEKLAPAKLRRREYALRESVIFSTKEAITDLLARHGKITEDLPWLTEEAKQTSLDHINQFSTWFTEIVEQQSKAALSEEPLFTSEQVEKKLQHLKDELQKLSKTKKPKEKKTPKPTPTTEEQASQPEPSSDNESTTNTEDSSRDADTINVNVEDDQPASDKKLHDEL